MSDDMALPSSEPMLICIGHSPVKPLAASPLMGSTAQSKRRSNVRRNFMAGIIAEAAPENAYVARPYDRSHGYRREHGLYRECAPAAPVSCMAYADIRAALTRTSAKKQKHHE